MECSNNHNHNNHKTKGREDDYDDDDGLDSIRRGDGEIGGGDDDEAQATATTYAEIRTMDASGIASPPLMATALGNGSREAKILLEKHYRHDMSVEGIITMCANIMRKVLFMESKNSIHDNHDDDHDDDSKDSKDSSFSPTKFQRDFITSEVLCASSTIDMKRLPLVVSKHNENSHAKVDVV
mmetsp:Transcript_11655/g.16517  ORF Transcript_11655/g.16517 Transcript_11655/m.16517 type:complete len:182 (+) Transcript_11655:1077-1622(+)